MGGHLRTGRYHSRLRSSVAGLTALFVLVLSIPLWADEVLLQRLTTDDQGNFIVLFSLLDSDGQPVDDVSMSDVTLEAVSASGDSQTLTLGTPEVGPFTDSGMPFRIIALVPDTDLFNGTEGDPNWPNAENLRSSLMDSLNILPQRDDLFVDVGMYNIDLIWIPGYSTNQLSDLGADLLGTEYATGPATADSRVEDPFAALEMANRARLMRRDRTPGAEDFVHFFIVVTSTLTTYWADELTAALNGAREILDNSAVDHVVPMLLVYDPFGSETSESLDGYEQFAQAFTPDRGVYRVAVGREQALSQLGLMIQGIATSFVLSFDNSELEASQNYVFRLSVSDTVSNDLEAQVVPRAAPTQPTE